MAPSTSKRSASCEYTEVASFSWYHSLGWVKNVTSLPTPPHFLLLPPNTCRTNIHYMPKQANTTPKTLNYIFVVLDKFIVLPCLDLLFRGSAFTMPWGCVEVAFFWVCLCIVFTRPLLRYPPLCRWVREDSVGSTFLDRVLASPSINDKCE